MPRFLAALLIAATFSAPVYAADAPKEAAKDTPQYPEVSSPLLSQAPLPSDYSLGKKGAPITIVEYASMSCPHCAHFHKDTMPELKKNYIDTGKVLLIFRHYPLNEPALRAALLTDCVGEDSGSDRFFTFLRVLFDAQNKWAFDQNFLSSIETFAKVGGVSKERFDACMKDSKREVKLLSIKKDATDELGVDRTPLLFINGRKYDGDTAPEPLGAYLDSVLGKGAPLKAGAPKKVEKPKTDAPKADAGK